MFCFSFENTKPVSLLFGKKGQIGSDNRFSKKTELERSKFFVCKDLTKDLKLRKNNVQYIQSNLYIKHNSGSIKLIESGT